MKQSRSRIEFRFEKKREEETKAEKITEESVWTYPSIARKMYLFSVDEPYQKSPAFPKILETKLIDLQNSVTSLFIEYDLCCIRIIDCDVDGGARFGLLETDPQGLVLGKHFRHLKLSEIFLRP